MEVVLACDGTGRGQAGWPGTGLSPALCWTARSPKLLQVSSMNSADWAAAGVTGSLSWAGQPGTAGRGRRSCCVMCSHCHSRGAAECLCV